ncbi:MAG: TraR/DksA family transcriptional regulator [Acidimicrobiales bacterium]
MDASRDAGADDEHDSEGATIAYERAQVGGLVVATNAYLDEVERALDRLDAGRCGACVRWGHPISPERLDARSAATTSVGSSAPTSDRGPAAR